jgi:hypothetical protein
LTISAGAVAVLACAKDATFVVPLPDYAGIRWINAVPDTMQQDFRIVDIVSVAGLFNANFRGNLKFHQPIEAGTRTVRVFLSSDDPEITKTVLQESVLPLAVGASYTFIHAGFARTGSTPARAPWFITDVPPTPLADSVGLRIIHAGAGMGNLDINVIRRGSDTLPDVPLRTVVYGDLSTWAMLKADSMRVFHPRVGVDSTVFYDTLRVIVTAAGTKTPRLVTAALTLGAPNTINTGTAEPIGGAAIRGTVMTAVVVPASVPGSQATSFTTPGALELVDRRPPMLSPVP